MSDEQYRQLRHMIIDVTDEIVRRQTGIPPSYGQYLVDTYPDLTKKDSSICPKCGGDYDGKHVICEDCRKILLEEETERDA